MGDELFAAWALTIWRSGEELDQMFCLGGCRRSIRGWRRQEQPFQLFLATLQSDLIGLEVLEALTSQFCCLLRGHVSMLVEIDRIVRHHHTPLVGCLYQNLQQCKRLGRTS